jgi:outer membrane protein TolC
MEKGTGVRGRGSGGREEKAESGVQHSAFSIQGFRGEIVFRLPRLPLAAAAVPAILFSLTGCGTSLKQYVGNGFKVGPNYCRPPAAVAEHWIDAGDPRVRAEAEDLSRWWTVFNDPVLNRLIADAYGQNLSLREAGFRVLQARAGLGIARGDLFPQLQNAFGSYRREGISQSFFDQWSFGFSLAWELDFWGRFRRAVQAADDQLDASVEDYDYVLVTLLADVAANYVQIRTDQQRIALLEKNVKLQEGVREVVRLQLEAGVKNVTAIDLNQATSNLLQTQAQIPQLETDLRQATNRLCILLGIPPVELQRTLAAWKAEDVHKSEKLQKAGEVLANLLSSPVPLKPEDVQRMEELWKTIGTVYIPTVPKQVAVGIPAELLRRRPDVRLAERLAAAQAEQIGIAESELYPAFTINGTLGYQAGNFGDLFSSKALNGGVGPSFQWNLLNYGRIVNNIRLQDARFQELVVAYQNTVLQANEEVEGGLVRFLRAQDRADLLRQSAEAGQRAVIVAFNQLSRGTTQFNQYAVIEQGLVQQEDLWAQARGEIAQGLIAVYRALGGGWEIRLRPEGAVLAAGPMPPPGGPRTPEQLPIPPRAPEPPPRPPMAR